MGVMPTDAWTYILFAVAPVWVGVRCEAGEAEAQKAKVEVAQAGDWVAGLRPLRVMGDGRLRHAGEIARVEPLSDGRRAVICAGDGTARMWDLVEGKEIRRFSDEGDSYVWMALLLPGEKEMLTTGAGGGVILWDLETGEVVRKYDHGSTTYRVALAPDGKTFFAVDSDEKGIIWDLESGEKVREITTESGGFYSGIYLDEGKVLATGGDDQTLTYWEVATGKKLGEVKDEKTKDIFTLALSPDGTRFAMCCEGGMLVLREGKREGKEIWKTELDGPVRVAAWSPDGGVIGVTCGDDHLYVINPVDGEVLKKFPVGAGSDYAVAFTRDGKEILGAANRVLYRFDIATGKRVFPEEGSDVLTAGVSALAVSGSGEVYVAGAGGTVLVYDLGAESGEASRRIASSAKEIEHLAVSPDGKTLLAGVGSEKKILVIDVASGKEGKPMNLEHSVNGISFVGNGRAMVASDGQELEIWDLEHPKKVRSLLGHTGSIYGGSVSADGSEVASFSEDGTVRLWDLATGVQIEGVGLDGGADPEGGRRGFRGGVYLGEKGRAILGHRGPMLEYWEAPAVGGERPDAEALDKLYGELNSDDFRSREMATARLIEMGNEALKEIEGLAKEGGRALSIELAMRLERVRTGIAGWSKMGKAKGSLSVGDDVRGLAAYHGKGLWMAVDGTSAEAALVVGDIHEGKPRVLRKLSDGFAPSVFGIEEGSGRIITGNRDGTLTVWGLE